MRHVFAALFFLVVAAPTKAQQLVVNLNHVEEDERTAERVQREMLTPLIGNRAPFLVTANNSQHGPLDVYAEVTQFAPSVRRARPEFDVQLTMTVTYRGVVYQTEQYREINADKLTAVLRGMSELSRKLAGRLPPTFGRVMVVVPPRQPMLAPPPVTARFGPAQPPTSGSLVFRKVLATALNQQAFNANLGRIDLPGLVVEDVHLELHSRLTFQNIFLTLEPELRFALQEAPFDFEATLRSPAVENGRLVLRGQAVVSAAHTYGRPRIEFGDIRFLSLNFDRAPLGGELIRPVLNRRLPELLRRQVRLHEQAAQAINEEIARASGEQPRRPAAVLAVPPTPSGRLPPPPPLPPVEIR